METLNEGLRALAAAGIGPAHRAAPEIFSEEHTAVCRNAIAKWDYGSVSTKRTIDSSSTSRGYSL